MNPETRRRLIDDCRERLHAAADSETAACAIVFFPSNPPVLGTPSGLSRELGAELARRIKIEGNLDDAIAVASDLYASGIMEEGASANEMLGRLWRWFVSDQWSLFDRWIDNLTCWGTTDSFCLKVAGRLVERDGPPEPCLREWARRADLWHRRAALVCMIRPARRGAYLTLLYSLMDDQLAAPEPLVQKAVGWLLRELYKGNPKAMLQYMRSRRSRLSSIAWQAARRALSPEEKGSLG